MKLCLIGKYPPIEGGVSATTYWIARGLAEKGHEIHVVTNADEVEQQYRLTLEEADWWSYQPEFPESGGRVHVSNVQHFDPRTMRYIPIADPFVSRLAGLATETIRHHDCQAILAYYFEPYAVAAWLASRWTNRPLLIKHAGSDLDRLFRVPDLARTYKEVLCSADAVITRPPLMPRFWGMGVEPARLLQDPAYSVPAQAFHPGVAALDVNSLAIQPKNDESTAHGRRRFDSQIPTIGCYGKIGETKGTYDLIAALGRIAADGCDFQFLAMVGSPQGERLASLLREAGIADRTWILPFLPNWKVPSFIRTCTAVCFLERAFPVAIHGPIIPREVMACGTCLVLSGEIAEKNRYRADLSDGHNLLIVEDPRDLDKLAVTLRSVITDPESAKRIGANALRLSQTIEDFPAFVSGMENILAPYTAPNAQAATQADESPVTGQPSEAALELVVPDLLKLVREKDAKLADSFTENSDSTNPFSTALRFCTFVVDHLKSDSQSGCEEKLQSALLYLKARLLSAHDPDGKYMPPFVASDRLLGHFVSEDNVWQLYPIRGNSVRIEEFDYDVSALSALFVGQLERSLVDIKADLAGLPKKRSLVLFQKSVNLISRELQIDDATMKLLTLCDGIRLTSEVFEQMCGYFGLETGQREDAKPLFLAALDRLYRSDVIIFAEQQPGGNWKGGTRWDLGRLPAMHRNGEK